MGIININTFDFDLVCQVGCYSSESSTVKDSCCDDLELKQAFDESDEWVINQQRQFSMRPLSYMLLFFKSHHHSRTGNNNKLVTF